MPFPTQDLRVLAHRSLSDTHEAEGAWKDQEESKVQLEQNLFP